MWHVWWWEQKYIKGLDWRDIKEGRPKRRWEVNTNRDLEERVWEGLDWIDPAQGMDRWQTVVTFWRRNCFF